MFPPSAQHQPVQTYAYNPCMHAYMYACMHVCMYLPAHILDGCRYNGGKTTSTSRSLTLIPITQKLALTHENVASANERSCSRSRNFFGRGCCVPRLAVGAKFIWVFRVPAVKIGHRDGRRYRSLEQRNRHLLMFIAKEWVIHVGFHCSSLVTSPSP